MNEPKTAGIPPASEDPLKALQFANRPLNPNDLEKVRAGAWEVSNYHVPSEDQKARLLAMSRALESFLLVLVENCPSGPERSTAISRAREAKFWGAAAISLEK
jgi:hypothetical protein